MTTIGWISRAILLIPALGLLVWLVLTASRPRGPSGSLALHLDELGDLACIVDGDLVHGSDARDWVREDYGDVDAVITNPPWTPDIMAEIMWMQSRFVPAWFLIYSDWLFTRQSAQLMRDRCTDIVPIGRLKWIPDTKSVGFDNCCWVRMSVDKQEPVVFWPMSAK